MKLTIRLKLLIGFTLLLTLSSLVQGAAFIITKQYIVSQIGSSQASEARKGASAIESFFASLRNESAKLALDYQQNPQNVIPVSSYLTRNNEYIKEIVYLSPLGKEQLKFDTAGQVAAEKLSYEIFSEPFKSAVVGIPAISKVYYSGIELGPRFDMFSPIYGETGGVVGVIKLRIHLDQLRNEIVGIKYGENGYIYVVSDQGRLITHPRESFVLERPNLSARPIIAETLKGTTLTQEHERYLNEENIPVVAKAVKIPDYNWVVVLEQPVSEAYAFPNLIQNLFIWTLVGSFVVLLLIALFLSENLTRSVRRLEQSAQEIEKGKGEKTVIIDSGDEIESLSHSFASLIDKLIQREHILEKTTTELAQANSRLQQLDKLKDEFVSVASHELRTPMTAVKSYLWMALEGKDGNDPQKHKYYLQRAYSAVDRLMRLVSDMLNVSRIDSGRISIELRVVDLQKMVQEVFDEVMPRVQELGLNLIMDPTPQLPQVVADSDKVKEVLFNLIGNALKFTPKGGNITVSFVHKDNMIETIVSDTGTGIDPANIAKLFQKFSMISDSYMANSSIQGTGLGLYICKSIIELHGGKIWAQSEGHGKGTQFVFSLKVATAEDTQKYALDPSAQKKPMFDIIHTGVE